jgi:hypothetical protein
MTKKVKILVSMVREIEVDSYEPNLQDNVRSMIDADMEADGIDGVMEDADNFEVVMVEEV